MITHLPLRKAEVIQPVAHTAPATLADLDNGVVEHISARLGNDAANQRRLITVLDRVDASDTIATTLLSVPQATARELLGGSVTAATVIPRRVAEVSDDALLRASGAVAAGRNLLMRTDAAGAAALGAFTAPELDRRTMFFNRFKVINRLDSRQRSRLNTRVLLAWLTHAPTGPIRPNALECAFARRHLAGVLEEITTNLDAMRIASAPEGHEHDRATEDLVRRLPMLKENRNDPPGRITREVTDEVNTRLPELLELGLKRTVLAVAEEFADDRLPQYGLHETARRVSGALEQLNFPQVVRAQLFTHLTAAAVRTGFLFDAESAACIASHARRELVDPARSAAERAEIITCIAALEENGALRSSEDGVRKQLRTAVASAGSALVRAHRRELGAIPPLELCENLLTICGTMTSGHGFSSAELRSVADYAIERIATSQTLGKFEPEPFPLLEKIAGDLQTAIAHGDFVATPDEHALLTMVMLSSQHDEHEIAPPRLEAGRLLDGGALTPDVHRDLAFALTRFLGTRPVAVTPLPAERAYVTAPFHAFVQNETTEGNALLAAMSTTVGPQDLEHLAAVWSNLLRAHGTTPLMREHFDRHLIEGALGHLFDASPAARRRIQNTRLAVLDADLHDRLRYDAAATMHRFLILEPDYLEPVDLLRWAELALVIVRHDPSSAKAKLILAELHRVREQEMFNDADGYWAAIA